MYQNILLDDLDFKKSFEINTDDFGFKLESDISQEGKLISFYVENPDLKIAYGNRKLTTKNCKKIEGILN